MNSVLKNWRTTLAGLLAALAGFVLFSPSMFPHWAIEVSKFVMAGGLGSLGILSKDVNSHSTVEEVEQATDKAEAAAAPVPTPLPVTPVIVTGPLPPEVGPHG